MTITEIASHAQAIIDEVERVIVGKRGTVRKAVLTLMCDGHVLLEDIPGVGKTTLAKALAKSIGGDFRRIQFTPDLLPSDVTGSSIFNQRESEFEFRPGPVFGNVVLVDEINRATPKTQSALLEAMEEKQVTTDGETRPLPRPFFVIATQNAIEMTGTYPLPEAQLDRFFSRLSLGYPERDEEAAILGQQQVAHPLELVTEVVSMATLQEIQTAVRDVFVHDTIRHYIVDVVRATRESNQFLMGASPRGSLHLMRAAQANAALSGHDFVRPDDVKEMASAVLGHRVLPRSELRAKGLTTEEVIQQLLDRVSAPVPVA
ncbi:AAA family ATPase [Fimbriimonas ginsengisoli]|uniref:ATPase n=1 Tax=Fimbriimonas ginsengisoli Gsoil 348 TaxID=661478 RepID=A0A068NK66_FIMGI|nr:MoxR family ATPase [Fimbriimonas ginsengisoli]AIE83847.1 ATPase [Fimbriimonas ginsengisoli Gsoil 348]